MARAWDDYLKWVESYDVFPKEITDLGADRVFAILRVTGKAKGDGLPMETVFFDVLTLRAGSIVRLEEYRDRAEALEAVGQSEQNAPADS
jgi:ketosteroid isomerase-like protein